MARPGVRHRFDTGRSGADDARLERPGFLRRSGDRVRGRQRRTRIRDESGLVFSRMPGHEHGNDARRYAPGTGAGHDTVVPGAGTQHLRDDLVRRRQPRCGDRRVSVIDGRAQSDLLHGPEQLPQLFVIDVLPEDHALAVEQHVERQRAHGERLGRRRVETVDVGQVRPGQAVLLDCGDPLSNFLILPLGVLCS